MSAPRTSQVRNAGKSRHTTDNAGAVGSAASCGTQLSGSTSDTSVVWIDLRYPGPAPLSGGIRSYQ